MFWIEKSRPRPIRWKEERDELPFIRKLVETPDTKKAIQYVPKELQTVEFFLEAIKVNCNNALNNLPAFKIDCNCHIVPTGFMEEIKLRWETFISPKGREQNFS